MKNQIPETANIATTLDALFPVSEETEKSVERMLNAKKFRMEKFDAKSLKNKQSFIYFSMYLHLAKSNKELLNQEYVAKTKRGMVETTVGEFVKSFLMKQPTNAQQTMRSNKRFNKAIKKRIQSMSAVYEKEMQKDFSREM